MILSVFGDIALAIGPEFKQYLEVVLSTLTQASKARIDSVSPKHCHSTCDPLMVWFEIAALLNAAKVLSKHNQGFKVVFE